MFSLCEFSGRFRVSSETAGRAVLGPPRYFPGGVRRTGADPYLESRR